MKKRILAIVMVMALLVTTMTACGNNTKDQVNQVINDFNALVTDVADLSMDLVSAALSGVDISAITDKLQQVVDFINSFGMSTLDEVSSAVLNGLITQIQSMATIVTNLKTQLSDLLEGLGSSGDSGAESAESILTQVTEIKATVEEVKGLIQNMEPATE